MNDLRLLGACTERLVVRAGFDSLESLAVQAVLGNLTNICGIGERKAGKIKEVLAQRGLRSTLSNEEYFLIDVLKDGNETELVRNFLRRPITDEQKQYIDDVISRLPERDQVILRLHCGLGCGKATFEEIAQRCGRSCSRVHQIAKRAIRVVKDNVRHMGGLIIMSRAELQQELFATRAELAMYKQRFGAIEDKPIEDLGLSARTYHCLKRARINTIEELKETNLSKVWMLGSCGIEEVNEKLSEIQG